jgi:hypothetical protein
MVKLPFLFVVIRELLAARNIVKLPFLFVVIPPYPCLEVSQVSRSRSFLQLVPIGSRAC